MSRMSPSCDELFAKRIFICQASLRVCVCVICVFVVSGQLSVQGLCCSNYKIA